MDNVLKIVGRERELFLSDFSKFNTEINKLVKGSKFLVVGGAGSIGQAVVKEIFKRNPQALHVVDISENNLVELVRDIRSEQGYIEGDFRTFALDIGSIEFDKFLDANAPYDYCLNLAALKHVRSERDQYTLMRMIHVNIINTVSLLDKLITYDLKKYFCVSTDKAANPTNIMGASKRLMEMFLSKECYTDFVSMARFANVAFSDGSLLHGFNQRLLKRQPVSAPKDIKRYFMTPKEAGALCLASCLLGQGGDIFFPNQRDELRLVHFPIIVENYFKSNNYKIAVCDSEDDARKNAESLISQGFWPCYFFNSDTTGEKGYEEFYTNSEILDLERFEEIGIIKKSINNVDENLLSLFSNQLILMRKRQTWNRSEIIKLFEKIIPNFSHIETGKFLDQRM